MPHNSWQANFIDTSERKECMEGLHVQIALTKGQFSNKILKKAKEIGLLPGQPHILEYLCTNDGCTQRDVCEAWDLDRSTVSGLVERMERDGLIRVERDLSDRRKKRLFLTKKGGALEEKMNRYMKQLDLTAFKGMSKEEQRQFLEMLLKIYQNLQGVEENGRESDRTK